MMVVSFFGIAVFCYGLLPVVKRGTEHKTEVVVNEASFQRKLVMIKSRQYFWLLFIFISLNQINNTIFRSFRQ